MTTSPHITTDHAEIRRWIQAHHGAPARDGTGGLRIDFLGVATGVEHLSWKEWFTVFDDQNLALCYQEPDVHGGISAWCELVPRARTATGATGSAR
ncbi:MULTISPECIES: hypothetical protein [unclassified Rhodococcus (in: high G+C Gram-positive bacteria)]|uniref:hypothetical protein n=1 Tax=unclassified Rhodococcus (in: high G+C Gram-positive bacteria) TaxID=192944 RepID=UPI00163A09C1|nr:MULTISPECIES: hypothetical protein [unclassified Rhodococcus (in: high G+C Gram-positive bacteria)]MBC2644472.1 hypothetical protein [Rhodococcus sp. 3A]MBC2897840.1 hypothetical protein [Rhodococcus sp. 4CII]